MSWLLLLVAFANLGVLVWALRQLRNQPDNIALWLMLSIIVPVVLDSATVAGGRWIGFGDLLETLNRIRFAWFVLAMPLLWAICLSILANAGFAWAQSRLLLIVLIAGAVAVGGWGAAEAWQQTFHPACAFDIKRYVLQVPADQACMGSSVGDGSFGLPVSVPLGTLAVALTGVLLLWKRRYPWLAMICAVLIAIVAVPQNIYTTFITYPTDALLTATLTWIAIHFYSAEPS